MPRKSKEELKNNISEVTEDVTPKKKAATTSNSKKDTKSKKASSSKLSSKNTKSTKTSSAKTVTAKKFATKTATKSAKSTTSKAATVKAATKATNKTSSKTSAKSSTTTKKKSTKTSAKIKNVLASEVEYYDLPYRYNETVVKILAQTPTTLFIYWDISDDDRNSYIEKYGEDFFNSTKPVLVITNKTMNYTFEIEINDFANSWYLHVNDPDCDYSIELGRRPISHLENVDSYIHVATSNDMEMPNNHILFDKLGKSVFFKNIKNNYVQEKEISSISFIKNIGKYGIYEIYKELYRDSLNIEQDLRLNLTSSSSSGFTAF